MFKVMTLNINHYNAKHGPWETRKERICRVIDAAGPDVVALQAVGRDPKQYDGMDQASQIAEKLPQYREVVFREASEFEDGVIVGSAFLSKRKFSETGCLKLSLRPGLEDGHSRILMKAGIDVAGGPMTLYNAHFSWVYSQARDNVEETLTFINSRTGPGLLLGDFNTTPEKSVFRRLKQAGWFDVWANQRGSEKGFTFESDQPHLRIDYILANHNLRQWVKSIDLLGGDADGEQLSDHLGLIVALAVD